MHHGRGDETVRQGEGFFESGSGLGKGIVDSGQVLHEFGLGTDIISVDEQCGEAGFLAVHFKEESNVIIPVEQEGHYLGCEAGVGSKGSHAVVTSLKVKDCCSVVAYRSGLRYL